MTRRDDLYPPRAAIVPIVAAALAEDTLPLGDLSASLVAPAARARGELRARASGIVAGISCVIEVCRQTDERLACSFRLDDGDSVDPGTVIGEIEGPLRSLLTAERSALNFLSHLSGIATLTHRYVEEARAHNATVRVLDTRKTTPGLRALEKAAVRAGGGTNHRANLSDAVLIKDNYRAGIAIADAVARALERWPGRMVEVECDTLDQVAEAVVAGATHVLCDNMTPAEVAAAVGVVRAQRATCRVEASGGIDLTTIGAYADAGADFVSVGALTHSAPILDLGLDIDIDA